MVRRREPACRVCGCTQTRACSNGCAWVEVDLCSTCHDLRPGNLVELHLDESRAGSGFRSFLVLAHNRRSLRLFYWPMLKALTLDRERAVEAFVQVLPRRGLVTRIRKLKALHRDCAMPLDARGTAAALKLAAR